MFLKGSYKKALNIMLRYYNKSQDNMDYFKKIKSCRLILYASIKVLKKDYLLRDYQKNYLGLL